MNALILKTPPNARFRFGEALGAFAEESHNTQKTTSAYLHSDTLWSALVNAWALACPETVEDFISECKNGHFKLSSAFYRYKDVFFLPKPVTLNLFKVEEPKKLKKIKFISKGIWEEGIVPENWFDKNKCTLLQNESIVALKSEIDIADLKLFYTETLPKVRARDVADREDSFYFQTDLFLSAETNWYFLLENRLSEKMQQDFTKAMQTIVNMGIGGERSTGCGALTAFEETDFNLNISGTVNASLSLIAPQENEPLTDSFYQTIKRGGRFLEKGKSLPMIQMLLEGAVLGKEIKGRIVELNSSPKILRYGLNLTIPIHNNLHNYDRKN